MYGGSLASTGTMAAAASNSALKAFDISHSTLAGGGYLYDVAINAVNPGTGIAYGLMAGNNHSIITAVGCTIAATSAGPTAWASKSSTGSTKTTLIGCTYDATKVSGPITASASVDTIQPYRLPPLASQVFHGVDRGDGTPGTLAASTIGGVAGVEIRRHRPNARNRTPAPVQALARRSEAIQRYLNEIPAAPEQADIAVSTAAE